MEVSIVPENIGAKIRAARLRKRMTQEDLARAIDTTKQNIYKYENGVITNIPIDRIEAIAAVLSMKPSDLVGWSAEAAVILSSEERRLLSAWRLATPSAQEIALETLENHPAKQDTELLA